MVPAHLPLPLVNNSRQASIDFVKHLISPCCIIKEVWLDVLSQYVKAASRATPLPLIVARDKRSLIPSIHLGMLGDTSQLALCLIVITRQMFAHACVAAMNGLCCTMT